MEDSPDKSTTVRTANTRLGLRLFLFYGVIYLAFALVNAFAPHWVEWQPAGGVNLAIWWGMGLIGLAFALALVYEQLCRSEVDHQAAEEDRE
ncbi:MAG: DUF485 domain-containing protein [Pirellulaceae bacterium]|nr:DUF485 domain-containing protein [Pirellulaceae bacterium]